MAEGFDEEERGTQDIQLSDGPTIGVISCDDEGYETAGKKQLPTRAKSTVKEGRKIHDCSADDDGYETAGKKQLAPTRVKSGEKQGRKSRCGSTSPRTETKDSSSSGSDGGGRDKVDLRVHKLIEALEGIVTMDQLNRDAVELLRLVPDGYIPLPHQVGGHRHIDGKVGFLRCISEPHLLYKPVQEGSKGVREVSFYDSLFGITSRLGSPKETFPSLVGRRQEAHNLLPMIPSYYGLANIADRSGKACDYLVLEDITHRFVHPCIMDLKIGQRVWDDHADNEKIEREKKKYPAQETLGFRIIGMRTYRPHSNDYMYYDRHFGRSVTDDTAKQALSHFFEVGDGSYRTDIINRISSRLTTFIDWMVKQDTLRLFATSLLIVYEGGPTPGPEEDPGNLDIRLVDFAHCYERDDSKRPDGNALYGVKIFMKFLSEISQDVCK